MKYGIWRHENALGNSGEHTVALAKHIKRVNDTNPEIYVEHFFQECFARCIDGVKKENIKYFDKDVAYGSKNWKGYDDPYYKDICMPHVYSFPNTYPSNWPLLGSDVPPDITLKFPENEYENKFNLPKDAIVIQIRERGSWVNPGESIDSEANRYVDPHTFRKIALYYAYKGHKVVRIGSPKHSPFPPHENILDWALTPAEGKTMMDDLYVLANSKLFISSDSGVWPIVGGMKKKLLLTNVNNNTELYNFENFKGKHKYANWLLTLGHSKIIFKKGNIDNTFSEIVSEGDKLIESC